jgi:hypothetical protein
VTGAVFLFVSSRLAGVIQHTKQKTRGGNAGPPRPRGGRVSLDSPHRRRAHATARGRPDTRGLCTLWPGRFEGHARGSTGARSPPPAPGGEEHQPRELH